MRGGVSYAQSSCIKQELPSLPVYIGGTVPEEQCSGQSTSRNIFFNFISRLLWMFVISLHYKGKSPIVMLINKTNDQRKPRGESPCRRENSPP